ncbi:MAG TPA: hypothetical protein VJ508_18150 [Saprospiraceae bacterium]|nr:hypothetical protein [Saprospiraceae bacterium]
MKLSRLALLFVFTSSTMAHGQSASFNRYTDDLPQLLETDAATVIARGMTHDFAAQICKRLGGQVAATTEAEATEWTKRNGVYLRSASAVFNEIGDRYLPVGGEQAKQGYLQSVLVTTAKATNQHLVKQLNGATLDNSVVPPEAACMGLSRMLHDGVGDFKNTPEVTRALVSYMRRKGIK